MASDHLNLTTAGLLCAGGAFLAKYGSSLFKPFLDGWATIQSNQRLSMEREKNLRDENKGLETARDTYYNDKVKLQGELIDVHAAEGERLYWCGMAGKPCERLRAAAEAAKASAPKEEGKT